MAQQLHTTATSDLSFLMILFLLSYVLSSAPRYVRDLRKQREIRQIEKPITTAQLIKAGKTYTIDPYIKAWKLVRNSLLPNTFNGSSPDILTGVHSMLATDK